MHRNKSAQPDFSQQAERAVCELTDSEPVNGEDLLASPKLRRKLREAKARERLHSKPVRK